MKVIMPFWHLELFPRYEPQLTAIAENLESLTLLYIDGTPKKAKNIEYQQVETTTKIPRKLTMNHLVSTLDKQIEQKHDLVYSQSGRWQQIAGHKLSQKLGIPHIIRLRGDDTSVTENFSFFKKLTYDLWYKKRIHESWLYASKIIPIANHLIDSLPYDIDYRKVTNPIPNGVNTDKFNYTEPPTTPTIGYVGRISPEKGSDFLYTLINDTPQTRYLLAGPIQTEWNAPLNATLLGMIPYAEIQKIYQASNIILLPSRSEGWPNTLLEAYASGRPVIITPEGIPDECELYGYKHNLYLGTWIQTISNLKYKRLKEIGLEAREYAKQFSWEEYGARMVKHFEETLKTPETQPQGINIYTSITNYTVTKGEKVN